jgi:hypothetical protein
MVYTEPEAVTKLVLKSSVLLTVYNFLTGENGQNKEVNYSECDWAVPGSLYKFVLYMMACSEICLDLTSVLSCAFSVITKHNPHCRCAVISV